MAYLGCPACKFVWIVWNDNDTMHTNHWVRQKDIYGLPCPLCFAEMKIIMGDSPKLCHHGKPINCICRDCRKSAKEIDELQKKLDELKKVVK